MAAGHIRKRTLANGSISYQAKIPSPANPRKDIAKTFATRTAAQRWLTAQAAALDRGDFIDPRRAATPFRTVVEEYRATWADLAPKTRVGYTSILNQHLLPEFGSTPIGRIDTARIQTFANRLAQDLAPNTVRRVLDPLRGVLRTAVEHRYISTNPATGVKLPRKTGASGRLLDIHPLTHEQVNSLVALLDPHWQLPVLVAAYAGLRAGELWALRRDDIDLHGDLTVDEALKEVTQAQTQDVPAEQRLTPSLIVGPTKTYAKRKVSLPDFLNSQLQEHLARPLPGGNEPTAFIFTTPSGSPVRHNLWYKRTFAPAAQATRPQAPPRFHDLRHTCAAWLIDAGAPALAIKLRLGHQSIQTTFDLYGHLFPSAERALAGLLDQRYNAANPTQLAQPVPIDRWEQAE